MIRGATTPRPCGPVRRGRGNDLHAPPARRDRPVRGAAAALVDLRGRPRGVGRAASVACIRRGGGRGAFLRCGILAHGFVLARYGDCGWSRPVAFSCKRRGFCPSCIGRRMADFAAHLADRVVPSVPVRQWVLTVPHALRARMMFDPALTSAVLRELIAAVSSWLRRRAHSFGATGTVKTGAIAVIQRFNSAAAASPHFHTLFLDGVFSFAPGGAPLFHPTPAPRDEDVAHVVAAVCRRVERRLATREPSAAQLRFEEDASAWCALAAASSAGANATGPTTWPPSRPSSRRPRGRRGHRHRAALRRRGWLQPSSRDSGGRARSGRSRAHGPLPRAPTARQRSPDSPLPDGRLQLELKRPWRDGFDGVRVHASRADRAARGARPRPRCPPHALLPGVFAPAFAARAAHRSRWRAPPIAPPAPPPGAPREEAGSAAVPAAIPPGHRSSGGVFVEDVLECARCHRRMTIVAALTSPPTIERVLRHLGLPTAAPQLHPATTATATRAAARPGVRPVLCRSARPRGFRRRQP